MERRVEELEVKVAFLEHTLAELDEVVRALRDQVDALARQLAEVKQTVGGEVEVGTPKEERPPHY